MKKTLKLALSALAALLLCAALLLPTFATGSDDFVAAVAALDNSGTYAQRKAAADQAASLLAALDEGEKTACAEAIRTLEAEQAQIAALASKAEAFLDAVAAVLDATNINNKIETIGIATAPDVAFSDESYPGVAEAVAALAREKATVDRTVEACEAFLDAVAEAEAAEGYPATRAALDVAYTYLRTIDNEYAGILTAKGVFDELCEFYADGEIASAEFLRQIKALGEGETYRERHTAYLDASRLIPRLIDDYPGVAEGLAALTEAEAGFEEDMRAANAFIVAVGEMELGGDLLEAILHAYEKLPGVDKTVDGVDTALKALTSATADINAEIRAINDEQAKIRQTVVFHAMRTAPVILAPAPIKKETNV